MFDNMFVEACSVQDFLFSGARPFGLVRGSMIRVLSLPVVVEVN